MSKFKIGDIVYRSESTWNGMKSGELDEIVRISGNGRCIDLRNNGNGHSPDCIGLYKRDCNKEKIISVEKKITIKLDGYRKTITEKQALQLIDELIEATQ